MNILNKTALIVTVGGSYKPVVSAINDLGPDYIVFICSEDTAVTKTKGSYTQILSSGNVIKAEATDERATLPNIPTQVGIKSDQFEVVKVHPDDVDDVYRVASEAIARLHAKSYIKIVCNYTGGTKSMTAALVIAGLDIPGVELEFVSGARSNLDKVTGDDSIPMQASVEHIRFQKKYETAIAQWQKYDYSACAVQMRPLAGSRIREHQILAQQVYIATQGFSAWDNFDHATAQTHLDRIKAPLGKYLGAYVNNLFALQDKKATKRQAAQILDVWLNAQRCAVRERYDDAMARCYRLVEWSAQWLLLNYANIETASIPADKVPTNIILSPSKKMPGQYQAGLIDAWTLAAALCPESCATFWQQNRGRLKNIIQARNHSILAHGFEPVSRESWLEMRDLVEHSLMPELLPHMESVGIKEMPVQLPTEWFGT